MPISHTIPLVNDADARIYKDGMTYRLLTPKEAVLLMVTLFKSRLAPREHIPIFGDCAERLSPDFSPQDRAIPEGVRVRFQGGAIQRVDNSNVFVREKLLAYERAKYYSIPGAWRITDLEEGYLVLATRTEP